MKLTLEEKVQLLDGLDVWHTKPLGATIIYDGRWTSWVKKTT